MGYVTGKTVKKLREKLKITQKELAERINVSDKTISKWETEKGLPDIGIDVYKRQRQYNYAYRLPLGSLDGFDWINIARTNYGKEILLPVSDASVPNVDTESFSLVRSVRSPGRVIGFLAVQLTGENLTQLLETGGLYDIEMMLLCDDKVLYQSSRFPGAKGGAADPNALRETLKDEYLVSVSRPQNSPCLLYTSRCV